MKTTIEPDGPTKRKLYIDVEPGELKPYYEATLRRLAGEVKIPGFRKGKVPRAVLESKVGKDAIREELLKDALPEIYAQAVGQEDLKAITYPKLEVTSFEDDASTLSFTATVEVRPEFDLPDYIGIVVERPSSAATDEEIDGQLDKLRERFGTLEEVGRGATEGDYLTIHLHGYKHTEQIEGASAEDLLYELGSNSLVPDLDDQLKDKRPGDILQFNSTLPERFGPPHGGEEVSFRVIVKQVQMKKLPELDDEFAKTASEFDSLEQLRADLRERIESVKKLETEVVVRNRLIEQLIEDADVAVPESMLASETESRLSRLLHDIEHSGASLAQYLEATNSTEEDLFQAYRKAAEVTVKADLILENIAEKEGMTVTKEDLQTEVASLAERMDKEPEELLGELVQNGRVNLLAGDILRRKALELMVEKAEIKDEPSTDGS